MFNPAKPNNFITLLPPKVELETKVVLKATAGAGAALAELKGYSELLPDKQLLIDSIVLQEAKDSSAIENIVTTHDELFRGMAKSGDISPQVKEVLNYRKALWEGFDIIKKRKMLTTNTIITIQEKLEANNAGIRKLPGTQLKNDKTGEVIYTPPDNEKTIRDLLANLEMFINDDGDNLDWLVKMAVAHYQFESIHPFYDGNGRTGRIVNVLYLSLKGLLDSPILYMSKGIISHKSDYYRLFREVTIKNNWEEWILFILKIVRETSLDTLNLIRDINKAIERTESLLKEKASKIYSKELVEILYKKPYIRINDLIKGNLASRNIASGYLKSIEKLKVIKSVKAGRDILYENTVLTAILKKA